MALLFDVQEANQFCWETSLCETEEQSSQAIPRQRAAVDPVLPVRLFTGKLELLPSYPLFFSFFILFVFLSFFRQFPCSSFLHFL
jgi:hypothetical protein